MKQEKILPVALKKGDVVAIAAPAGPVTEKQIASAIKKITKEGYQCITAENINNKYGYLAGTDEERSQALNKLFRNPDIKAIIAARGGFGCTKILKYLDFEALKKYPKIISGYSDITALTTAIYKKTGLITFHGSMPVPEESNYTINSWTSVFSTSKTKSEIICEEDDILKKQGCSQNKEVWKSGKAKGILFGGNLTLLEQLIGTEYDFSGSGKILFWEEINEPPYKIDRMLTHLENAGKFKGVKGMIIGICRGCDSEGENSLSLNQVIKDFASRQNFPIMSGFSFGHIVSRCTLPVGVKAEMNTEKFSLTLLEKCVE